MHATRWLIHPIPRYITQHKCMNICTKTDVQHLLFETFEIDSSTVCSISNLKPNQMFIQSRLNNELCRIHIMEYFVAIRINQLLLHTTLRTRTSKTLSKGAKCTRIHTVWFHYINFQSRPLVFEFRIWLSLRRRMGIPLGSGFGILVMFHFLIHREVGYMGIYIIMIHWVAQLQFLPFHCVSYNSIKSLIKPRNQKKKVNNNGHRPGEDWLHPRPEGIRINK